MKYSALIVCAVHGALAPFALEAQNDDAAVDKARKLHTPPDEGGDYTIEVTCLESAQVYSAEAKGLVTRPANAVVSSFGVTHEPAAHVAVAVYAERERKAAEALEAERVAKIQSDYLDSLGLKLDESGKPVKK